MYVTTWVIKHGRIYVPTIFLSSVDILVTLSLSTMSENLDLTGLSAEEMARVVSFVETLKSEKSGIGPNGLPMDDIIKPSGVDSDRFVLFPIQHHDLWGAYKKASQAYWVAEEIRNLPNDVDDWENKLNDKQRYFIKMVLAFFASADGIVNENLLSRFATEVQYPEARQFYGLQAQIENIHCVSAETPILTSDGQYNIGDLSGKNVKVWNGHEFSEVVIRETAKNAQFTWVRLSNGASIKATSQHRWFIAPTEEHPADADKPHRVVYTEDLKLGDKIADFTLPFVVGAGSLRNPELSGYLLTRGVCKPTQTRIDMDSPELAQYLGMTSVEDSSRSFTIPKDDLDYLQFIPYNYDVETRVGFIRGLLRGRDAHRTHTAIAMVYRTPRAGAKRLADHGRMLMTSLGLHSESRVHYMGGFAKVTLYVDTEQFESNQAVQQSITTELWNTLTFVSDAPSFPRRRARDVYVTGLCMATDGPSYCFNDPLRGAGTFSGVCTGNSECYSLMINELIKDEQERNFLFKSLEQIPSIHKKGQWAMKWMYSRNSTFGHRLFAFMIVEGVLFSGSFAAIYYLNSLGLLPALSFLNKKIAVDELSHAAFAAMIYKDHLKYQKPSDEEAYQIMKEAVELEIEFQTEALPCSLIGMNSDQMAQYIKFTADCLLVQAGLEPIYKVSNPFPFMESLHMPSSVNFFEKTNGNYSITAIDRTFEFDDEF